MDIVLLVAGILILGFLLNVVLKQSYNFVFYLAKNPLLWICLVTGLSGLFWFVCGFFGLSVSVTAWATIMAFFMNLPPSSTTEAKTLANEMYEEMGIKHGALLYRLGLAGFVVAAIASWIIFYGQTCNSVGQCSGFF